MSENKQNSNWFKDHIDTVILFFFIVVSLISSIMWMNGKFNELEKDIAIIKTVLVMKQIMPSELAYHEKKDE